MSISRNRFIRVAITYVDNKPTDLVMYYYDAAGTCMRHEYDSYAAARRDMLELSRYLHRPIYMHVNRYTTSICYKEVYGFT